MFDKDTFWLSLNDLVEEFDKLYICRVFKNKDNKNKDNKNKDNKNKDNWKSQEKSGEWKMENK